MLWVRITNHLADPITY